MSNKSFHTFDQNWAPIQSWLSRDAARRPIVLRSASPESDVPVMSGTVLGLDLLLQESSVDLRMAAKLVLSDVGATLQVLQLIAGEYALEDRPTRMEDCLASLDIEVWFGRVSARTFSFGREHVQMAAVWRHSHLIAQYAQLVAESLEGVSPEAAYLVGLLHEVEAIPEVMDWNGIQAGAVLRALPAFVCEALSEADEQPASVWRFVLAAAHDLAGKDFDATMLPGRRFTGVCAI